MLLKVVVGLLLFDLSMCSSSTFSVSHPSPLAPKPHESPHCPTTPLHLVVVADDILG